MKKILFLLFLLIIPTSFVSAYSNRYFTIEVPESYELHMDNIDTFQWINEEEGSNIVLSISLKTNEKDIYKYTKEEKNKFIDGIIRDLETQYYKAYEKEMDVKLVNSKEIKINGYKGISIETQINDFLSTGSNMNQYINVVESKNFLYSLVYSTGEKTYNEKDYNQVKKALKILDEKPINYIYSSIQYFLNYISLGILVFFGIIVFRRLKNDKKQ